MARRSSKHVFQVRKAALKVTDLLYEVSQGDAVVVAEMPSDLLDLKAQVGHLPSEVFTLGLLSATCLEGSDKEKRRKRLSIAPPSGQLCDQKCDQGDGQLWMLMDVRG